MKSISVIICLMFISSMPMLAQSNNSGEFYGGLEIFNVINRTNTNGIGSTLVNDPIFKESDQTFRFIQNQRRRTEIAFHLYGQWNITQWFAWLPEISLTVPFRKISNDTTFRASDLEYNDVKNLQYKIYFDYGYLTPNLLSVRFTQSWEKWRIFADVSFPYSINTNQSRIRYWSNLNNPQNDLEIESSLKKYLIGENIWSFKSGFGVAVNCTDNFLISGRYSFSYGLTDAIRTEANGYGFINNDNKRCSHNFSLGILYKMFTE